MATPDIFGNGVSRITSGCQQLIFRANTILLAPLVFQQITKLFNITPTVDLFASQLNSQVDKYVSYQPDPRAIAVNAFLLNWK